MVGAGCVTWGELLDGHTEVSGRRLDNGPGPRGESGGVSVDVGSTGREEGSQGVSVEKRRY